MEEVRRVEYFLKYDPNPDENHQYFLCAVKLLEKVCDSGSLTNKDTGNILRDMLKDFCSGKISRSFFIKTMFSYFDTDPNIRSKFQSCFPKQLLIEMMTLGEDEHQIKKSQLTDQKNIEGSQKVGQPQFEELFHQEKSKDVLVKDHNKYHKVDAAQEKLSSQPNIQLFSEFQQLKISDISSSKRLEQDSSPQIQNLSSPSSPQPPKLSLDSRKSLSPTNPVSRSPGKKKNISKSGNLSRPVKVKSQLDRTQKSSESRKLSRPQKLTSQSVKVHESFPKSQSKSSLTKLTSPSKSSPKVSSKPQKLCQQIRVPQTAHLRKTLPPFKIRTLSRKLFSKKRSRSMPENLNSLEKNLASTKNVTPPKCLLKQSKLPFGLRSDISSRKSQQTSNLTVVSPVTDASTHRQYALNDPQSSINLPIEELTSRFEQLHISPQKVFHFPQNTIKAWNQARQIPQQPKESPKRPNESPQQPKSSL